MPSTSKKQHNFMAAVAHNPAFAKKAGVPQSVGKDFSKADKGKTFKEGGSMASKMNPGFMAMMAKKKAGASKMGMFEKSGKDVEKKGVKEGSKADMAMDKKQMMSKGGTPMKKMASGGLAAGHKSANGIASKGKTQGKKIVMSGNRGMKSGGATKKYC
jgi:hypothetical protein